MKYFLFLFVLISASAVAQRPVYPGSGGGGGGTGTVTSVSVTTANGVSGSVATPSTTPAITLTLGAITPLSVNVSGLTASQVVLTDGSKNLVTSLTLPSGVSATNMTLTTPSLGAATATSLLASGNVDGTAPVTVTTGSSASLGTTFKSGYTFNQNATAATAVAYTLPTAAAGLQYCVGNSYNGSAATTGVLTVNASASGQFIIFTDGTLSATGGNVTSGGAAADFACFVGVDSTHWYFKPSSGTWTKH